MRNALFHKCVRTSAVHNRATIAIITDILLFFQQHSSISSSMDSSHSAPYAPYSSNNISGYPGSGGTNNAGNPGNGGGGSTGSGGGGSRGITMNAIPATMTAAASSPVPSASPVLFSRPIMLAKQRNLLSQSSNSIPAALGMVRTKPTPPIRRAMTVGDRLGSVLGQDEAAKRITEFFKNYIVRFSVNLISNFVPNKWVWFSINVLCALQWSLSVLSSLYQKLLKELCTAKKTFIFSGKFSSNSNSEQSEFSLNKGTEFNQWKVFEKH